MSGMKTKTIGLSFILCLAAGAFCLAADDPMMGTWKLNEAKSKIAPGMGKNLKVIYSVEGKEIRILTEGVDKDGKPNRSVWTGNFDEKDYLVSLDPDQDVRSYKQIDANTLELVVKKETQIIATGRVVLSADGKTRTVTTTGTDASGKKFENIAVYDKQ